MPDTIPCSVDGLSLRRRLGRSDWGVPEPFGSDGWVVDHKRDRSRVIVTVSDLPDQVGSGVWTHASISHSDRMPTYDDLVYLHHAVWGSTGWSYQVFAPAEDHVNIHSFALHLWGHLDGSPALPNFGYMGSI